MKITFKSVTKRTTWACSLKRLKTRFKRIVRCRIIKLRD